MRRYLLIDMYAQINVMMTPKQNTDNMTHYNVCGVMISISSGSYLTSI